MKRYENRCCNCATPAYPCLGENCPERNVLVYYCDIDKCKAEIEEGDLFEVNGKDLCGECLRKKFKKEYE